MAAAKRAGLRAAESGRYKGPEVQFDFTGPARADQQSLSDGRVTALTGLLWKRGLRDCS